MDTGKLKEVQYSAANKVSSTDKIISFSRTNAHTYILTYIHILSQIRQRTTRTKLLCMAAFAHMNSLIHTHIHLHTHKHTQIHTNLHTHTHTFSHAYKQTHTHTRTHTYKYTYIHTHTDVYVGGDLGFSGELMMMITMTIRMMIIMTWS